MQPYRLHINNSIEHHFLNIDQILYIRSNGNYCNVYLEDGTEIINISKQLGQIARIINNTLPSNLYGTLVQVGRFHIVNINHIQTINISKKQIVFDHKSPNSNHPITISPSTESLSTLCDIMSERHPTTTNYPSFANEEEIYDIGTQTPNDDTISVLGKK